MSEHAHDHDHDHDHEGTVGMALGFRIVEEGGKFYLTEAEIAPYVDAPEELGVTLVFHPLEGIDPSDASEEVAWPSWTIDVDDDLERDASGGIAAQFQGIVRQLHGLSEDRLREFLRVAMESGEVEGEDGA